jgi:hypothetical protein
VAGKLQVTVDCLNPPRLAVFWAEALGYKVQDPPSGFTTWNDYWRSIGVPDEELDFDQDAADSIVDPAGAGPRIWFQKVPEPKSGKNRLHFDVKVNTDRSRPLAERRERAEAESRRLVDLGAAVLHREAPDGVDHYFLVMTDPEGNEFCVA